MSKIPIRLNDTGYFSKNLNLEKPLFADTETNYLYKGIRLVQLFQEHWDSVVIFDVRDVKLQDVYNAIKSSHIVFHNICYDAVCFQEDLGINVCPFEHFADTLLLARQAFAYDLEYFSLDKCFEFVYGKDVYTEIGEKKEMQKSFLSTKKKDMSVEDITETQLQYAAADVWYMPKFWDKIKHIKDEDCYKVDKLFIRNLLRWQRFGMPVNRKEVERIRVEQTKLVEELTAKLPEGLNVNSPKQVKELLGFGSSDKTTMLNASEQGNEVCGLIVKKRQALKLLNFLERYSFRRVRGFFSPTTISGRVRCDGSDDIEATDNLLQIPRALKGVFGFEEGDFRRLVYCDFAQLELRTACCNTSERNIEKAFRDGLDLHAHTASLMFEGLSYEEALKDKEKRTAAKMCNFSLLYCSSAKTFKNAYLNNGGGLLTDEQAVNYRALWKDSYKGFSAWHDGAVRKYQRGMLDCKSKNGRRYKAKMFTDICGVENQSIGADAAKMSLNLFLERNPNAKVLCFIHDAIIVEASNDEEAGVLAQSLGECMVEGWFKAIENLPINDLPMPLEVGVGRMLYEAEGNAVWKTEGLKEFPSVEVKPLFEEKEIATPQIPDEVKNRDVLFDADTPFYIAATEADGDLEAAKDLVINYFKFFKESLEVKSVTYFLTIGKCFRYSLCDSYKANRDRDKTPKCLGELKRWALGKFKNVLANELLEADDLVYYHRIKNPNHLVCSIDKDVLKSLEGKHWNPSKAKVVEISKQEALVWPYLQCVMGDSSDNIKGAKGLGEKKTLGFIDINEKDEHSLWLSVLEAYRFAGQTIDEALLNMRLVRLDQFNGESVVLWQPK